MNLNDLMTITQAATEKQVSRQSIYRAIECKQLNPVQVGDKQMLWRADVERYTPVGHRPKKEPEASDKPKRGRGRPRKVTPPTEKQE